MSDFDIGRERVRVDCETMILRSDRHFAASQIFDRLIRAAMPEFQFECRSAVREAKDLMAETNSKDRLLADQIGDGFVRVWQRGGIAWTV